MTDVLLCVGNSMMGDDGAGPLLAEMCTANPAGNWQVIDGGSAPENDVVAIRELRPDRLLIVDATDMGLNPGEIRIVDPDDIAEMFLMTTHNMPLNYLIDQIIERHIMGGHQEHLGNIVRIDNTNLTGVQPHVCRIDNQQPVGTKLADRHHVVFGRAPPINHLPVSGWVRRAHLRQ